MRFHPVLVALFSLSIAGSPLGAEKVYEAPPTRSNPAAVPQERDDWLSQVQQKFTKYGDKPAAIVFDGDSITNRWEITGKAVWAKRYAGKSANFGIEGDRTENLLWRLSKGQVDGVDPKVVVLMIGTNNIARHTPEQVSQGIQAIVEEYQKRCPTAHIILTAVFARSAKPTDPLRLRVNELNQIIGKLAGPRVTFLNINDKLTQADGTISPELMPDGVHPVARGYEIWADALQPIIDAHL